MSFAAAIAQSEAQREAFPFSGGISQAHHHGREMVRASLSISQRDYANFDSGPVPKFTEVSIPELNDLLTALRLRVIFPAHLAKKQRDLIFKPKYEELLATEPVTTTIGGEEFTLENIEPRKDVPSAKKTLFRAIELMKEKKDWGNLPNLLQGLRHTGFKTQTLEVKEKVVRKARQAGRQEVILECIRRVADTGMKLKEPEFVTNVMLAMHWRALESDWHEHETAKALFWAEMVVSLMEDTKHAGSRMLDGENDPRLQPDVIGILLDLAAVRAVKHLESRDVDGKVAEYTARLLGTPLEFRKPAAETEYELNPWLSAHAPVLHGMYEALKVLEPSSDIALRLKVKSVELETMLSTYKELLSDRTSRKENPLIGLQIYDKLLGSQA